MIDVVQEQVQRAHALDDAGLQRAPFLRGDHARDQVERQDAVDRGRVGIDGEGDAALQQVAFGIGGAAAQRLDRQMAQPVAAAATARDAMAGPAAASRRTGCPGRSPPERRPAASAALGRTFPRMNLARFVPRCHGIATSGWRIDAQSAARDCPFGGQPVSECGSVRARCRSPPPRRRAARSRRTRSCRSSSRRGPRRRASRCCWT